MPLCSGESGGMGDRRPTSVVIVRLSGLRVVGGIDFGRQASGSGCPTHCHRSQHGGHCRGVADGVMVVVVVGDRDHRRCRPSRG